MALRCVGRHVAAFGGQVLITAIFANSSAAQHYFGAFGITARSVGVRYARCVRRRSVGAAYGITANSLNSAASRFNQPTSHVCGVRGTERRRAFGSGVAIRRMAIALPRRRIGDVPLHFASTIQLNSAMLRPSRLERRRSVCVYLFVRRSRCGLALSAFA